MNWFRKIFSGNVSGRVSSRDPLVIDSPKISFLNLVGSQAESIVTADKQALGGLFEVAEASDDKVPVCDVLLIYCNLAPDGTVGGQSGTLRNLIDSSTAKIAVVASQNSGDNYMAAGKRDGHHPVNLVMTLDRTGDAFSQFFGSLFRRMFTGESMLSAWVELAPQHSGSKHDDCPETIFLPEISHIIFRQAT